jgi:hypothetical protein
MSEHIRLVNFQILDTTIVIGHSLGYPLITGLKKTLNGQVLFFPADQPPSLETGPLYPTDIRLGAIFPRGRQQIQNLD